VTAILGEVVQDNADTVIELEESSNGGIMWTGTFGLQGHGGIFPSASLQRGLHLPVRLYGEKFGSTQPVTLMKTISTGIESDDGRSWFAVRAEESRMNVVDTNVYGVVRDESGMPLSGATVYIVTGTGSWLDIAALTNEKGEYKLGCTNLGSYLLSVHHENFMSASVNIEIREVPSGVDVTLVRK